MNNVAILAKQPRRHPRLLLVDDEPLIVEALACQLERDFEVLTTTDPLAVPNILEREPVAAIVSDLRMPMVDGVQLLEQARLIRPNAARILLTGYADISSAMNAVNTAGVHGFLSKPCPAKELVRVLQSALAVIGDKSLEPERHAWMDAPRGVVVELPRSRTRAPRCLRLVTNDDGDAS